MPRPPCAAGCLWRVQYAAGSETTHAHPIAHFYTGPVSSASTSTGTPTADAGAGPDQARFFLNLIQTIFTRSDATLLSSTASMNGHNVYTIHVTPRAQASGNGTGSFNYDGNVYL